MRKGFHICLSYLTDMKLLAGFLTMATYVVAVSGYDCNYQCPAVGVSPVCGTDGRTYPSACYVQCIRTKQDRNGPVSVAVSADGRCPSGNCVCPAVVDHVCGSNGWTYANRCQLECDSARHQRYGYPPIHLASSGRCPASNGCVCTEHEELVCGTDGRTYGNPCKLGCESERQQQLGRPPIFIARNGSCSPQPCDCPPFVYPVCGNNSKSYRNTCFLECASVESQKNGGGPITLLAHNVCTQDKCLCPADLRPVCASNGNTYNNECALKCANDGRFAVGQAPIVKLYDGPCKDCVCPRIWDPVCGSDGRSYANSCELGCENQRRWYQSLSPLTYVKGECGCNCQLIWKPVCGSDFNTYTNECVLGCENKRRVHNGLPALHITQYGKCSCDCYNRYRPVCGSDNHTYWNVCWLNCSNFYLIRNGKPGITVVKTGPC